MAQIWVERTKRMMMYSHRGLRFCCFSVIWMIHNLFGYLWNATVAHSHIWLFSDLLNAHLPQVLKCLPFAFYLLWQACAIYSNWWPLLSGESVSYKLEVLFISWKKLIVRTLHLQLSCMCWYLCLAYSLEVDPLIFWWAVMAGGKCLCCP